MSKEITQSQIDRFDWERGDVLSIIKEDAARLAALPVGMFAPPFHALLKWFLGEDAEAVRKSLTDPRDLMLLDGLMEHQRANAQRRGDYLTKQRDKSLIAKKCRDAARVPRDTHGTPTDDPSIRRSESESISRSASDKTYTSLRDACPSPSAFRSANGKPSSAQDNEPQSAKKEPIPCISKWEDGKPIIDKYLREDDIRPDPIGYLFKRMSEQESEPEKFRGALRKYRDDLGEGFFFDVVWDFVKEQCELENRYRYAKTTTTDKATLQRYKDIYKNATAERGKHLFAMLNARKKDLGIA